MYRRKANVQCTGQAVLQQPGVFRLYLVYLPRNNWFTAMHIVLYMLMLHCVGF